MYINLFLSVDDPRSTLELLNIMLHRRHKEESKQYGKEMLLSTPLSKIIIQLKLIDFII